MSKIRLMLVMMVVAVRIAANCQTAKTPVFVSQGGADSVGASVAYALKEDISKSNRYSLAPTKEIADYVISLASTDIGEAHGGHRGTWSAIAVLVAKKSACSDDWLEVVHGIEISGTQRVKETASDVLANFDKALGGKLNRAPMRVPGNCRWSLL